MRVELPIDLKLGEESCKTLCEQIPYLWEGISGVSVRPPEIMLSLNREHPDPRGLARLVEAMARSVHRSQSKVVTKVIAENQGPREKPPDPHPHLEASGQLRIVAPGAYAYSGGLLRIMRGLDRVFREYALGLGAVEQSYPVTVPTVSLAENGYLSGFPQNALFASALRHNFHDLEHAAKQAPQSDDPAVSIQEHLGPASQALSPTVCYHCFELLRDSALAARPSIFTATALCHRHEGSNLKGLERLQTFTMREIVFFGAARQVGRIREEILEHSKGLLSQWGLGFQVVTASDPFFASGAEQKKSYQTLMGLKYEMRAKLPYAGSSISVASYNHHQASLVTKYGISGSAQEEDLNSGCVGYGFERLALAIMSQFGTRPGDWPLALQKVYEEGV